MKYNDDLTRARTRSRARARARARTRSSRARTRARARASRARSSRARSALAPALAPAHVPFKGSAADVTFWLRKQGLSYDVVEKFTGIIGSDLVILTVKHMTDSGVDLVLSEALVKIIKAGNPPEPEPIDANDDVDDPEVFCHCGCRHEA